MTPFEQYLLNIGYKRYRKTYTNRDGFKYEESITGYYFTTMETGGLDYRYILNGDFGNEIIFGLREREKPPTLCWPRPEGLNTDDEMNKWLKNKTPEEIYAAIHNI